MEVSCNSSFIGCLTGWSQPVTRKTVSQGGGRVWMATFLYSIQLQISRLGTTALRNYSGWGSAGLGRGLDGGVPDGSLLFLG